MKKQLQIKQSNKVLTESLLEKTIQDLKKFMLQTFITKTDLKEAFKEYPARDEMAEMGEHITNNVTDEIKESENRILSKLGARVGLIENITDSHEKRLKVLEHAKN